MVARATLVLGAALTCCCSPRRLFGRFVPRAHGIKTGLIAILACHGLMTFALPPFQGPDENGYWKLALMFYRTGIADEPSAHFLPEALETRGRVHDEVRFDARKLRAAGR